MEREVFVTPSYYKVVFNYKKGVVPEELPTIPPSVKLVSVSHVTGNVNILPHLDAVLIDLYEKKCYEYLEKNDLDYE